MYSVGYGILSYWRRLWKQRKRGNRWGSKSFLTQLANILIKDLFMSWDRPISGGNMLIWLTLWRLAYKTPIHATRLNLSLSLWLLWQFQSKKAWNMVRLLVIYHAYWLTDTSRSSIGQIWPESFQDHSGMYVIRHKGVAALGLGRGGWTQAYQGCVK